MFRLWRSAWRLLTPNYVARLTWIQVTVLLITLRECVWSIVRDLHWNHRRYCIHPLHHLSNRRSMGEARVEAKSSDRIRLRTTRPESTGILPMQHYRWDIFLVGPHWVDLIWNGYPNYSTDLNGKMIPNLNRFGSILYIVCWPAHGYPWISWPNLEVGSGVNSWLPTYPPWVTHSAVYIGCTLETPRRLLAS